MSSPGQIFVTGVVILANARPVDSQRGNRNVVFDVNFPVKDGKKRTLGLLRYFTPEDRVAEMQKVWDNYFTQAFIVAKIAAMPDSGVPSQFIEEDDIHDYAFVGDITEIILTENTNVYRNPYIIASGITGEFDSNTLTFSLNPSQYINLPHTVLNCPISCFFDSESKKWKTKKPMPITGTTVSVTGALTKIKRDVDQHPTFELEIDNIAHLGRQSGGSTATSPSSISTTSRTRFNYDNPLTSLTKPKQSLDSDETTQLPSMPGPSSVALGKRKDTHDDTEHNVTVKRPHITDDTSEDDIHKNYSDTK